MQESIVFCSAFSMSSQRKFTFTISFPDKFLVNICGNFRSINFFSCATAIFLGLSVKEFTEENKPGHVHIVYLERIHKCAIDVRSLPTSP